MWIIKIHENVVSISNISRVLELTIKVLPWFQRALGTSAFVGPLPPLKIRKKKFVILFYDCTDIKTNVIQEDSLLYIHSCFIYFLILKEIKAFVGSWTSCTLGTQVYCAIHELTLIYEDSKLEFHRKTGSCIGLGRLLSSHN